jgi:hypothetical protein
MGEPLKEKVAGVPMIDQVPVLGPLKQNGGKALEISESLAGNLLPEVRGVSQSGAHCLFRDSIALGRDGHCLFPAQDRVIQLGTEAFGQDLTTTEGAA